MLVQPTQGEFGVSDVSLRHDDPDLTIETRLRGQSRTYVDPYAAGIAKESPMSTSEHANDVSGRTGKPRKPRSLYVVWTAPLKSQL